MTDTDDDLQQLYRQATSYDRHRPAANVRQAVLAHAQMTLDGKAQTGVLPAQKRAALAANWPSWKAALVASLLLAPLAGILVSHLQQALPDAEPVSQTAAQSKQMAAAPSPPPAAAEVADHAAAVRSDAAPRPMPGSAITKPAETSLALADKAQPPSKMLSPPDHPPREPLKARMLSQAAPTAATESNATVAGAAPAQLTAPAVIAARKTSPAADAATPQANRAAEAAAPQLAIDELNAQLFQAVRAGQLTEAESLLAHGAAVNARDANGQTALMVATRMGHEGLVMRLLQLGARLDLTDNAGLTALQYAKQTGNSRIISLLMPPN